MDMITPARAPLQAEPLVRLEKVTLIYGRGATTVHALAETNLDIAKGDFVALVGPSGCGKSTILKLVTGLIRATSGYIFIAGREVGAEPVRVGMAFQNPTQLPWLSIRDNIMLPLKIVPPFRQQFAAKRKGEFRDRVEALLAQVGLAGFGDKYPWQLSGGMLQRASLCRALIHDPQLLMLDEPFGALDQFTREELWAIMQDLWMTRRPTVLLVTHDLKEAGFLANRICVMAARPGRIIDDAVVPFPRPRTIEMSYEPDFVAMTQRLRDADHRRPRQEGGRVMNAANRRAAGVRRAHHRLLPAVGVPVHGLQDQRPRGAEAEPDPRHAVAVQGRARAAHAADALHHAGRLRARHPDRHRARHAGRLVQARLRRRLSAAGRLRLDPEGRGGADLRAVVRRRHRAGDPHRHDHVHLPDRRERRDRAGHHRARARGRDAHAARRASSTSSGTSACRAPCRTSSPR